MATLARQHNALSDPRAQVRLLEDESPVAGFADVVARSGLAPLRAAALDVLQVNLGKQCNQTCVHCHVDAGPDRKERMARSVMDECLRVVREQRIPTVDITGGAPEMHPDFRWFVEQCRALGAHVMVRCNLTIILANKKYNDLPEFYRDHGVEVICSLPFYSAERTDRQRGSGVFEDSIKALKMLNAVGFGTGTGLQLHLVYNPVGAFLPGAQAELEKQYKAALSRDHGIVFDQLYAITNLPISRFLEWLVRSENYTDYMAKLVGAFNPAAVGGVMCRTMLSVGYDGRLYDCDFNQMLELPLHGDLPRHISDYTDAAMRDRLITTGQHCYGCTAGAGSSCGGTTI